MSVEQISETPTPSLFLMILSILQDFIAACPFFSSISKLPLSVGIAQQQAELSHKM